jgi:Tfp pilus assembly protein PilO
VKSRDRIVLIALLGVGLLAGFWFAVLGPKRHEAKNLSAKVAAAQQRLAEAQAKARAAQQAKAGYQRDYATVLELGKAVPADDSVPSLLYQLESASRDARIRFNSIQASAAGSSGATAATTAAQVAALGKEQNGSGSSPSTAAPSSSAPAAPAGTTVGAAGFPTMPFALAFEGSYDDLRHLVDTVNRFVELRGPQIVVRGRLLQIDGISLTPQAQGKSTRVTATVNATAYLLPPDQGATNGATPPAPAGAAPTAGPPGNPSPAAPTAGTTGTSSAVTATPTATSSGETR